MKINQITLVHIIEIDNWEFKNFTHPSLIRDFEDFLTNKLKNNIFDKLNNKIEGKKIFMEIN